MIKLRVPEDEIVSPRIWLESPITSAAKAQLKPRVEARDSEFGYTDLEVKARPSHLTIHERSISAWRFEQGQSRGRTIRKAQQDAKTSKHSQIPVNNSEYAGYEGTKIPEDSTWTSKSPA